MAILHKIELERNGRDLSSLFIKKAKFLEKDISSAANILAYIGCVALFVLMLIGTADVIGRYLFNRPITGALEISQILLSMVALFGLAYCQIERAHIRVTVFYLRFSHRLQVVIDFIISVLALALFCLIVWQGIEVAKISWQTNRMISIFNIPLFPFQLVVPIGAFFISLVLISQTVRNYLELKKKKE